jgi:hypothetical protein
LSVSRSCCAAIITAADSRQCLFPDPVAVLRRLKLKFKASNQLSSVQVQGGKPIKQRPTAGRQIN